MSKLEPFNFTSHLRAVVKPLLANHGFIMKGTKFVRGADEVWFQRSSWNMPAKFITASEFYLNATLAQQKPFPAGRIARPASIPMPPHFQHARSIAGDEEKRAFTEALTEIQKRETTQYLESTQWLYSTENELVDQLKIAAEALAPYLAAAQPGAQAEGQSSAQLSA